MAESVAERRHGRHACRQHRARSRTISQRGRAGYRAGVATRRSSAGQSRQWTPVPAGAPQRRSSAARAGGLRPAAARAVARSSCGRRHFGRGQVDGRRRRACGGERSSAGSGVVRLSAMRVSLQIGPTPQAGNNANGAGAPIIKPLAPAKAQSVRPRRDARRWRCGRQPQAARRPAPTGKNAAPPAPVRQCPPSWRRST